MPVPADLLAMGLRRSTPSLVRMLGVGAATLGIAFGTTAVARHRVAPQVLAVHAVAARSPIHEGRGVPRVLKLP
jgi:hypothetical protein